MKFFSFFTGKKKKSNEHKDQDSNTDQSKNKPGCPESILYKPRDRTLDTILKNLEREDDVRYLTGNVLDITQLYLDSIINKKSDQKPADPKKERSTLETLFSIDSNAISALSHYSTINSEELRQSIYGITDELSKIKCDERAGYRYLEDQLGEDFSNRFYEFSELTRSFVKLHKVDTIIYAASGGLHPALILKYFEPNAALVPVRYSSYKRVDRSPKLPRYLSGKEFYDMVNGKNVILIDDDIDSGGTVKVLSKFILKQHPNSFYFATVLGFKPEKYPCWNEDKKPFKDLVKIILCANNNSKRDSRRPMFYECIIH